MYFPDIDSMPKSTYTIQTGGILGDIVKGIIEAPKNIIQGVIGIGKDITSGNVTLPSGETLKDVIKEKQQPKTHVIKAPEPQPAPKPAPKNIIQGVIGIGKDITSGNVTLPSGETLKDVIKEKQQPKTHVIKAPEPQPAPKPAPKSITTKESQSNNWIWIAAIGGILLVILLAR